MPGHAVMLPDGVGPQCSRCLVISHPSHRSSRDVRTLRGPPRVDCPGRLPAMTGGYLVRTFGCQMNEHDSERIAGLLESDGYARVEDAADARVVVLNTCAV